jgi:hypothetical protein
MESEKQRLRHNGFTRSWYRRNRRYKLEQNKKWTEKNRKRMNARVRLHRHDMTSEEHDALLRKQKNRCAICRKKFLKTPHIDHSHKTGRNRGLLCEDCNLGLGRLKDSVRILGNAIKYIRTVYGKFAAATKY